MGLIVSDGKAKKPFISKDEEGLHYIFNIFGLKITISNFTKSDRIKTILHKQNDVADYLIHNYINKYLNNYIPKIEVKTKKDLKTDKIIWQYWGQGFENLPEVVKVCYKSIDRYKNDYIVIRLTDDTIDEYIDIPDFIYKKFKENNSFKRAFFSDIIRLYLLSAYGGIWIDSTIYLTEPIPNNLSNKDFFMFQRDLNETNPEFWVKQDYRYFGFTKDFKVNSLNSFMISKPQNLLINALKDILTQYWKEEDFFQYYYLFQILFNELINTPEYKNLNCEIISDTLPHLLQVYRNNKYSEQLWNKIKKSSFMHKLKYYSKCKKNSILEKIIQGED